MLFLLLANKPPFTAQSNWDYVSKHLTSPVPSLLGIGRELPVELVVLVERMLAKEGAHGPTMGEVTTALYGLLNSGESATQPEIPPRRSRGWVLAGLLAGAAIFGVLHGFKRTREATVDQSKPRLTTPVAKAKSTPPTLAAAESHSSAGASYRPCPAPAADPARPSARVPGRPGLLGCLGWAKRTTVRLRRYRHRNCRFRRCKRVRPRRRWPIAKSGEILSMRSSFHTSVERRHVTCLSHR